MLDVVDLRYRHPHADVEVLRGVSLSAAARESVAVTGPSGAGKSTLLLCLAGVLVPNRGSVRLAGLDLSGASQDDRARIRLRHIGFVMQFAELVPELTLRENVELPLRLLGRRGPGVQRDAEAMLERLGIAAVAGRRPGLVSGGQAQRAAIARALVHGPGLVLADEPTGALDQAAGRRALELLDDARRDAGAALVVVTHDEQVAARLDRRVDVVDGVLTGGLEAVDAG